MSHEITGEQIAQFNKDGYLIIENLFDEEEMELLLRTAKADQALARHAVGMDDSKGGISRLTAWFVAGDDLYGMFARCQRVATNMEKLLGWEVYHYHSKMMLKQPRTGGAWRWHQDYGYWYNAGYLYPDMASCLIAVDRATKENGCLQVLKGSHKMGRIDHVLAGDQTGAEPGRVEEAMKHFELVHCEVEPGTAVFFHASLLHGSARNKSENPRWSLICCYTGTHNTPFNEPQHPGYAPLVKVEDSAIKECGARSIGEGAVFHRKEPKTYSKKTP
jgi:ectoine hydroxylase